MEQQQSSDNSLVSTMVVSLDGFDTWFRYAFGYSTQDSTSVRLTQN